MKKMIFASALLTVIAASLPAAPAKDVGLTTGQMAVLDVVMHGIVNLYSTNLLIIDSYNNAGITGEQAMRAVSRNRDFLKVLNKYAMEIKRQNATEDKETVDFLGKITEICTNLDLQLGVMDEYVDKNDKASLKQLEKYRGKLESLIESLVRSDFSE